jgi:ferric-dicitrate binding protein FerR (iron transport regulator)
VTNILGFEAHASIKRRAREWLIRLDGDERLTNTEMEVLRSWLVRSPWHRQELSRLSKFWQQANVLTELAAPLKPQIHRDRDATGGGGWRLLTAAGVTLAAFCLLGILSW